MTAPEHRGSEAPTAQDEAVAHGYPDWREKGAIVDGRRVTVMTAAQRYRPGEEIRVVHVVEATEAGRELYIMGPKEVCDEYLDDERQTPPSPDADPLKPVEYDGRVLPGPGVDTNYEVTTYVAAAPGNHRIQWRPGRWQSNELDLHVAK